MSYEYYYTNSKIYLINHDHEYSIEATVIITLSKGSSYYKKILSKPYFDDFKN